MGDMRKKKFTFVVPQRLTAAERNAIAGESRVAPNTVRRWETGQPIRPVSRARIEEAIEEIAKGKRP